MGDKACIGSPAQYRVEGARCRRQEHAHNLGSPLSMPLLSMKYSVNSSGTCTAEGPFNTCTAHSYIRDDIDTPESGRTVGTKSGKALRNSGMSSGCSAIAEPSAPKLVDLP